METYWPASSLTETERIEKTARRVGLSVPGSAPQEPILDSEEGVQEFVSTLNGGGPVHKSPLIDRLMRDEEDFMNREPKRATA